LAVKTHSCCLSNYGVRVDRFLFKGKGEVFSWLDRRD